MRTTLTLEPDIAARLNAEAVRTDRALKTVVNEALRRGLHLPGRKEKRARYTVRGVRLGFRPGVDTDKLNELADELETGTQLAKMRR